ncbi:hypothetical protein [Pseudoponticoccus marisrubri]|uniref:Uncharacterized protein n=1 Tax=Pseudoponticoccus marisrubri TaxID=1685382 RepID=A0A0W7WIY6_9RHOB|nr:hypothetical protein [Pseudoponticoccus marisrubri]KUF10592.1 hypothetical protein AVJ23_11995 [Pseudoponticoccus marisrubri]
MTTTTIDFATPARASTRAVLLSHNMLEAEDLRDALQRRGFRRIDLVRSPEEMIDELKAMQPQIDLAIIAADASLPGADACEAQAVRSGVGLLRVRDSRGEEGRGIATLQRPFTDRAVNQVLNALGF